MRKTKFQNKHYYHIYNRGMDKRDVFMDEKDYMRFLKSLKEFNCLEPIESLETEFLRLQINRRNSVSLSQNNGIAKFMHKLGLSYTKYFNAKYNRSGSLFQGAYKSIPIKTDNYLFQLSCYINGNPEIHKIAKAKNYQWSIYPDYLGKRNGTLCDKNII